MKYVIVPTPIGEWAILFPDFVTHSSVVNDREIRPVSAGFCSFLHGEVKTYGHSTSLQLFPRIQDKHIIRCSLGAMGIIPLSAEMVEKIYLSPPNHDRGTTQTH